MSSSGLSVPRVAQRTFAGPTISVGDVRRYVRGAATDIVHGAAVGGDMELAVSELVTTAIEHRLRRTGHSGRCAHRRSADSGHLAPFAVENH